MIFKKKQLLKKIFKIKPKKLILLILELKIICKQYTVIKMN